MVDAECSEDVKLVSSFPQGSVLGIVLVLQNISALSMIFDLQLTHAGDLILITEVPEVKQLRVSYIIS